MNAANSRNDRQRGPKSRSRRDAQSKRIGQWVEEHPLVNGPGKSQRATHLQGESNPRQAHVNDDIAHRVIDPIGPGRVKGRQPELQNGLIGNVNRPDSGSEERGQDNQQEQPEPHFQTSASPSFGSRPRFLTIIKER